MREGGRMSSLKTGRRAALCRLPSHAKNARAPDAASSTNEPHAPLGATRRLRVPSPSRRAARRSEDARCRPTVRGIVCGAAAQRRSGTPTRTHPGRRCGLAGQLCRVGGESDRLLLSIDAAWEGREGLGDRERAEKDLSACSAGCREFKGVAFDLSIISLCPKHANVLADAVLGPVGGLPTSLPPASRLPAPSLEQLARHAVSST